jgi:methylphosphotriester-DNA--protein-cysteine methyltransferase
MHRLYRKLNGMTIKDNHPLPRIDDQIDRLQGGTYFTTLDLKAGYPSRKLEEKYVIRNTCRAV